MVFGVFGHGSAYFLDGVLEGCFGEGIVKICPTSITLLIENPIFTNFEAHRLVGVLGWRARIAYVFGFILEDGGGNVKLNILRSRQAPLRFILRGKRLALSKELPCIRLRAMNLPEAFVEALRFAFSGCTWLLKVLLGEERRKTQESVVYVAGNGLLIYG